jgi:mannose-6-phosphate isomerase
MSHNNMIYPLLFEPVLKDYIWGGRNLERLYGRSLPEGITAESWEIAGHADGTTRVRNGHFAGSILTDVLDELGLDLIGENNAWAHEREKFPLLVKLLDANRPLSVQVHPDDEYALTHEGNELGKTEMWYVLEATSNAALILGVQPDVTLELFQKGIEEGNLEQYLHELPISTGDTVCVPAGTVHAILEGAVIAEIQQNSNTTYRVYDWNRVGADGKPRPLHIEKALDVIDFSIVQPGISQPEIIVEQNGLRRSRLCSNSYFTTEKIELADGASFTGSCDGSTLEIWGVVQGEVAVAGVPMETIQFVLLPAVLGAYSVIAGSACTLLRTYVT